MIYSSIYRDIIYSTTASTLNYYIQDNELRKIYVGRAIKAPSATTIDINITKICNNYLFNQLPIDFPSYTSNIVSHEKANRIFTLYDGSTNYILEQYNLLYDFDYESNFNGEEKLILSNPINGHLDSRMKILFTEYNYEEEDIIIEY